MRLIYLIVLLLSVQTYCFCGFFSSKKKQSSNDITRSKGSKTNFFLRIFGCCLRNSETADTQSKEGNQEIDQENNNKSQNNLSSQQLIQKQLPENQEQHYQSSLNPKKEEKEDHHKKSNYRRASSRGSRNQDQNHYEQKIERNDNMGSQVKRNESIYIQNDLLDQDRQQKQDEEDQNRYFLNKQGQTVVETEYRVKKNDEENQKCDQEHKKSQNRPLNQNSIVLKQFINADSEPENRECKSLTLTRNLSNSKDQKQNKSQEECKSSKIGNSPFTKTSVKRKNIHMKSNKNSTSLKHGYSNINSKRKNPFHFITKNSSSNEDTIRKKRNYSLDKSRKYYENDNSSKNHPLNQYTIQSQDHGKQGQENEDQKIDVQKIQEQENPASSISNKQEQAAVETTNQMKINDEKNQKSAQENDNQSQNKLPSQEQIQKQEQKKQEQEIEVQEIKTQKIEEQKIKNQVIEGQKNQLRKIEKQQNQNQEICKENNESQGILRNLESIQNLRNSHTQENLEQTQKQIIVGIKNSETDTINENYSSDFDGYKKKATSSLRSQQYFDGRNGQQIKKEILTQKKSLDQQQYGCSLAENNIKGKTKGFRKQRIVSCPSFYKDSNKIHKKNLSCLSPNSTRSKSLCYLKKESPQTKTLFNASERRNVATGKIPNNGKSNIQANNIFSRKQPSLSMILPKKNESAKFSRTKSFDQSSIMNDSFILSEKRDRFDQKKQKNLDENMESREKEINYLEVIKELLNNICDLKDHIMLKKEDQEIYIKELANPEREKSLYNVTEQLINFGDQLNKAQKTYRNISIFLSYLMCPDELDKDLKQAEQEYKELYSQNIQLRNELS